MRETKAVKLGLLKQRLSSERDHIIGVIPAEPLSTEPLRAGGCAVQAEHET